MKKLSVLLIPVLCIFFFSNFVSEDSENNTTISNLLSSIENLKQTESLSDSELASINQGIQDLKALVGNSTEVTANEGTILSDADALDLVQNGNHHGLECLEYNDKGDIIDTQALNYWIIPNSELTQLGNGLSTHEGVIIYPVSIDKVVKGKNHRYHSLVLGAYDSTGAVRGSSAVFLDFLDPCPVSCNLANTMR